MSRPSSEEETVQETPPTRKEDPAPTGKVLDLVGKVLDLVQLVLCVVLIYVIIWQVTMLCVEVKEITFIKKTPDFIKNSFHCDLLPGYEESAWSGCHPKKRYRVQAVLKDFKFLNLGRPEDMAKSVTRFLRASGLLALYPF